MAWNPRVHEGAAHERAPDLLRALRARFSRFRLGGGGPRRPVIVAGVAAALVVLAAMTSYYQIEPDEVGVLRRFGRYVGTTNPGPHVRLPFGIDQVDKVPVQRQLKMEFGFRSDRASAAAPKGELARESLMLTGDLNVAVVEWIVQSGPGSEAYPSTSATWTHVPCFRGGHAAGGRRPQRGRGAHHRP
jgi:membrane protease subunit HflK